MGRDGAGWGGMGGMPRAWGSSSEGSRADLRREERDGAGQTDVVPSQPRGQPRDENQRQPVAPLGGNFHGEQRVQPPLLPVAEPLVSWVQLDPVGELTVTPTTTQPGSHTVPTHGNLRTNISHTRPPTHNVQELFSLFV